MEPVEITCPYCWQTVTIEEPPPVGGVYEFVTDCEICCRPIRVTTTREPGMGEGEIRIDVEAES